jgi:hypothetical protein
MVWVRAMASWNGGGTSTIHGSRSVIRGGVAGGADIRTALDRNTFQREREANLRMGPTIATGVIENIGQGMGSAYIGFPFIFDERPIMSFTFEFGEGSPTGDEFPHLSVSIYGWDIKTSSQNFETFNGVNVLISLRGDANVKGLVHWTAIGRAFTNPIGGDVDGD